jgi:hypothetical protein
MDPGFIIPHVITHRLGILHPQGYISRLDITHPLGTVLHLNGIRLLQGATRPKGSINKEPYEGYILVDTGWYCVIDIDVLCDSV